MLLRSYLMSDMPRISSSPAAALMSYSTSAAQAASASENTATTLLPKSPSLENPYQRTFAPRFSQDIIQNKIDVADEELKKLMGTHLMLGNKRKFLQLEVLQKPLLAALNSHGYSRFVDAFAGTGIVSIYASLLNEFPDGSFVNEMNSFRHIDLHQSIHHTKEVIQAIQKHGTELRKICYRALNDLVPDTSVSIEVVDAWESARNEKQNISVSDRRSCDPEVKKYLLDEMEKNWDEKNNKPQNTPETAALSKWLQFNLAHNSPLDIRREVDSEGVHRFKVSQGILVNMFGSIPQGYGRIDIKESSEKLERMTNMLAEKLPNTEVTKKDGFKLYEIAKPGDVFFVDPPYLRTPDEIELGQGITFGRYTNDNYDLKQWKNLLKDLEEIWDKGAHIVMTNRWHPDFVRLLVSRGWRVSPPENVGRQPEIVITNFDWEGGTGAIRKRQPIDIHELLAKVARGTVETLNCQFLENKQRKSEQKRGVRIGEYFYCDSDDGYLVRFEPQSTGRRSSRLTRIVPDDSTIWQKSGDQKNLPQIMNDDAWWPPEVDAAKQISLSQQHRKPLSTVARLRSRSLSSESRLTQEPAKQTEHTRDAAGPSQRRERSQMAPEKAKKRTLEQAEIYSPEETAQRKKGG